LGFIDRSEIAGFRPETYQILQFRDTQIALWETKSTRCELFRPDYETAASAAQTARK